MQHSRLLPSSSGSPLPATLACLGSRGSPICSRVRPGRTSWCCSPASSWRRAGEPSRRRCASWGANRDPDFCTFHRILNRAAWSSRAVAGQLLILLVKAFVPSGAPVVIGLDDTIERRWGTKISARGIYRDPVRSSKGHFVKASGLRWLSAMLLVKVPWADRIMALPFLTLLAPSKRFYAGKIARTQDAARLGAPGRPANPSLAPRSLHRPGRRQRVRGHRIPRRSSQPCLCRHSLAARCQPVRLPAAKVAKAAADRRSKASACKKLSAVLNDRKVSWQRYRVSLWYGRTNRLVEIASGTAIWYRSGMPPVPIRWLLVRDPKGELEPQAFLATDLNARPCDILAWFVSRVGRSKSPSRKPAPISASKPSVSGPTKQSFAPRRPARPVLNRHPLGARPRQITKAQAENRRMVSKSVS